MFVTEDNRNNDTDERPGGGSHSRRDALMFGGLATISAMLAGGALAGAATPALAQSASGVGSAANAPFDIVIAIYKEGTLLDFSGPSEVFHRIPNTRIRFASLDGGPVQLEYGVVFGRTEKLADIAKTDLLLVPGGPDLREPMRPDYLAQIRRLAEGAQHITSVCTGSLVLAASGVLKGKRSACHWACVNQLAKFGAIPDPARFVEDDNGRFMSGGGVTSGIDFALRVAQRLRGQEASEFAQLIIEYDPDPPFRSGHPRVAPPEIIAMVEKQLPGATKGLLQLPGLP